MSHPDPTESDPPEPEASQNPFASDLAMDPLLSSGQHTGALITGACIAILTTGIGLFLLFEGYTLFRFTNDDMDPTEFLFSQLSSLEIASLAAAAFIISGLSVWFGLRTKDSVEQQIRRNNETMKKRSLLSLQAIEMRDALRRKAEQEAPSSATDAHPPS